MHKERMFDNQPLPKRIDVNIVKDLKDVGGSINGLPESELSPNCQIKTFDGNLLPAIWYPHTGILKVDRQDLKYVSVDFKGKPKEYSMLPSGWVLSENRWLPLVTRLLRIISSEELIQTPNLLERVSYFGSDSKIDEGPILSGDVKLLTSLGAAENPYYIVYLTTDKDGNLLPSAMINNWLKLDTKSVGYKSCGIGERVYGPGCYFGGLWTCSDRGSAKKVDVAVCKVKTPPWPTRYFWAAIDDVVFNAEKGGSIKAGRIKLLNEDQKQNIPDWVHFINS